MWISAWVPLSKLNIYCGLPQYFQTTYRIIHFKTNDTLPFANSSRQIFHIQNHISFKSLTSVVNKTSLNNLRTCIYNLLPSFKWDHMWVLHKLPGNAICEPGKERPGSGNRVIRNRMVSRFPALNCSVTPLAAAATGLVKRIRQTNTESRRYNTRNACRIRNI